MRKFTVLSIVTIVIIILTCVSSYASYAPSPGVPRKSLNVVEVFNMSDFPTSLNLNTGTLNITSNALIGVTITIGNKSYAFQTILTNNNGNILIGGTIDDSIKNLISAINLTAGAGTKYASSTTAHPQTTLMAIRKSGNDMEISTRGVVSINTSETSVGASWTNGSTTIASGNAITLDPNTKYVVKAPLVTPDVIFTPFNSRNTISSEFIDINTIKYTGTRSFLNSLKLKVLNLINLKVFTDSNTTGTFFNITGLPTTESLFIGTVVIEKFASIGNIINIPTLSMQSVIFLDNKNGIVIRNTSASFKSINYVLSTNLSSDFFTVEGPENILVQFDGIAASVNENHNLFNIDDEIGSGSFIRITNSFNTLGSFNTSGKTKNKFFKSGKLDETDTRISVKGNQGQKDSMFVSETRSNVTIVVEGEDSSGDPIGDIGIVDETPASADWIKDPSTEHFSVNTSSGVVTYLGNEKTFNIQYQLTAAPEAPPAQSLIFYIRINENKQDKSVVVINTANGSSVIYNGGIFILKKDDTIQLFKNNTTNAIKTVISNVTLLIESN